MTEQPPYGGQPTPPEASRPDPASPLAAPSDSPGMRTPPAAWQAPVEELGPAPGIQFADHGSRLMSYILDVVIVTLALTLFTIVVVGIIVASGSTAAGVSLGIVLVVAIIAISIGYFPWFWMRGGQTPGMRPFGLYVVRDADGGPVTGRAAGLRLLGYWINGIAFYVGFAWILVDKRRRGWHDLLAGTVVIKR